MLKIITLALLSLVCFCSPALADDFFTSEHEQQTDQQEDENSFTILNAFEGEKTEEEIAEEKRKKDLPWAEFEDVSGTEVEKKFLNSGEVKLHRELRKPLPERNPFGNRMDSLEDSVNNLRTPNVIDTLSK